MNSPHIYLSHPQVIIAPDKEITRWSLSPQGRARVEALAASGGLEGIDLVLKAVETAEPLAHSIGCPLMIRPSMHENDRQATGFLPPDQFEATADQFFRHPDQSVAGWETARDAQRRIVSELEACLRDHPKRRLLLVGHGAVGTLLYCHLAGLPISRAYDQPLGGGCFFGFGSADARDLRPWQPMEHLYTRDLAQEPAPKNARTK